MEPMKRLRIKETIGLLAPTAATAILRIEPVKYPTTAKSDALKSWLKTAVAAIVSAKAGILFHIDPISILIFFFIADVDYMHNRIACVNYSAIELPEHRGV